ncbi:MAG: pyruvate dehydrogenase complex dihydrolipoamide acetyltransferase [bacterium]
MASKVVIPRLSDTMQEGTILKWLKREGERVEAGEAIAEVETDKAVMEMEAYASGSLLKILVGEGKSAPVGGTVAIVGEEGEDISAILRELEGAAPPSRPKEEIAPIEAEVAEAPPQLGKERPVPSGRLRASPLARTMAKTEGIDLSQVRGSGPRGRVIKRDVEAYIASRAEKRPPAVAQAAIEAEYESIPLSGMRKTIARRLTESKGPIPHFYITIDVNMGPAMELRNSLNNLADDIKITFNDIIVKASASALTKYPAVNAAFAGDSIRIYKHAHIGIAVAVEDGLITPVIRDCDGKSLGQIAREARDLVERARERRLLPEEFTGATFTVSNLGMFDVENFAAIINPPEGAILAVGAIRKVPVVVDDRLEVGHRMKVTISCDHRAIDGATAAQFLNELKRILESPLNLMV